MEERLSNWERMRSGLVYNDFDEELVARRVRAKRLFRAYNKTDDEEAAHRLELLRELFAHVGEGVLIEPDFCCEFGCNISFGDRSYMNFGGVILDCCPVTIGDDVLMGPHVGLYTANHSLDADRRAAGEGQGGPITIGDKVWLGGSVQVVGGVTIGECSVVGTGSVVTHDIPAHSLAVGSPARVIRQL